MTETKKTNHSPHVRLQFPLKEAPEKLAALQAHADELDRVTREKSEKEMNRIEEEDPQLALWSKAKPQPVVTPENMESVLADTLSMMTQRIEAVGNIAKNISPEQEALIDQLSSSVRMLADIMPLASVYEQDLEAATLLLQTFEFLRTNPVITASPTIFDFVARLDDEARRTVAPLEILASVDRTIKASQAASSRHAQSTEIKNRIWKEWERLKVANPEIQKGKAANIIGPLAVKWNIELNAGLSTLKTQERAVIQVRDWLKPSKQRSGVCD
ncbi:hypothetical protein HAP94_08065 [Acidithiobacillus ferrivorans]|nr:hypothetical protein [Acidithiobacillus ferrivorans]